MLFLNILPLKDTGIIKTVATIFETLEYTPAAEYLRQRLHDLADGRDRQEEILVAPEPVPLSDPVANDENVSRSIPKLNGNDIDINWSREGLLGAGTFGVVRLATWTERGLDKRVTAMKNVAVKIYQLNMYTDVEEAVIMRRLDHENVLKVYGQAEGYDDRGRRIFMQIMEYVNPTTDPFENRKKDASMARFCYGKRPQQITLKQKIQIAIACWSGLAYTHQKGVFHRDLKPGNVLISTDLVNVKIADFGLSLIRDILSQYTSKKEGGTDAYKSPESFKDRMVPEKWDVWSMGLSLIELFASAPFWYKGKTPMSHPEELMDEVREATRRVMPRVDDLVRTMYRKAGKTPNGNTVVVPLAPLLEARAAALAMALSSLATTFRVAYPRAVVTEWLRDSLKDIDQHLEALRLASEHEEQAEQEKVEVLCPSATVNKLNSPVPLTVIQEDRATTSSSTLLPSKSHPPCDRAHP